MPSPIPLDLSPIIDKLIFGGVVIAVLSVAGLLMGLYVAHYGGRAFLSMLMGKDELDQHLDQLRYDLKRKRKRQDEQYSRRLKRERDNQGYRAWKKKKGW